MVFLCSGETLHAIVCKVQGRGFHISPPSPRRLPEGGPGPSFQVAQKACMDGLGKAAEPPRAREPQRTGHTSGGDPGSSLLRPQLRRGARKPRRHCCCFAAPLPPVPPVPFPSPCPSAWALTARALGPQPALGSGGKARSGLDVRSPGILSPCPRPRPPHSCAAGVCPMPVWRARVASWKRWRSSGTSLSLTQPSLCLEPGPSKRGPGTSGGIPGGRSGCRPSAPPHTAAFYPDSRDSSVHPSWRSSGLQLVSAQQEKLCVLSDYCF